MARLETGQFKVEKSEVTGQWNVVNRFGKVVDTWKTKADATAKARELHLQVLERVNINATREENGVAPIAQVIETMNETLPAEVKKATQAHNKAVWAQWGEMRGAAEEQKAPAELLSSMYNFRETHTVATLEQCIPLVAKALAAHRWGAAQRRMDAASRREAAAK